MSGENRNQNSSMNLEELLALLKKEHGDELPITPKKPIKPTVDEESSLDNFEFDDTPIEADYLNYNRIGLGVSNAKKPEEEIPDSVDEPASEISPDSVGEVVEEVEITEEVCELEELDELDTDETVEEIESVDEACELEELDELDTDEVVEEIEAADEVCELEEFDELDTDEAVEEIESVDEVCELEELDELDTDEAVEEIEAADEVCELEELDELDTDEVVEEIEAADEACELEELDELDTDEVVEEIESVDEVEEFEDIEIPGVIEIPEEADELEEADETDEVEELDEIEIPDVIEVSEEIEEDEPSEDVEETDELMDLDELEDDEDLDEIEEVEEAEELEDADELEEDLGVIEALDTSDDSDEVEDASADEEEPSEPEEVEEEVYVGSYFCAPKNRQKGSTTPIDEKPIDNGDKNHAVLPSRARDKEFSAYSQKDFIKGAYKARLQREFTLLGWALFAVVVAFLCENIHLFGVAVLSPEKNPFLVIGISLILIAFSLVIAYREWIDGTKLLFSGKIVPSSILLPMLVIPLVYYTYVLITGGVPVMLFGFAFAVLVLLTKLETLLRYLREAKTFRVVSSDKPKRVLSVLSDEETEAEADAFSRYVSPDAKYFAVKRTLFADGYFKMTNAIAKNKLTVFLFFALSFAAAVLVFVISMLSATLEESFSYALISFYYTMPFASLLFFEVPLFRAAFAAYEKGAAIIGEAAAEDYMGEGVVSFLDSDVFSPRDITLSNILLFRESSVEKLLRYTALVYDEINSPVAAVIRESVPQYRFDDKIVIVDACEGGLEVRINKERVLLGSYAYMLDNRIPIPKGYVYSENGSSELFVSCEGELLGKFDFEYSLDRDSKDALDYLEGAGYYIALRTLDPNITYALIKKLLRYEASPICLVRAGDSSARLRMRKRSVSPIVSTSRAKSLIGALVLSRKSARCQKIGVLFAALSTVTGTLVVLLSVRLGSSVLLSGLGAVLFQVFWLIPSLLVSTGYIRNSRRSHK